jgi:hypothetical protein
MRLSSILSFLSPLLWGLLFGSYFLNPSLSRVSSGFNQTTPQRGGNFSLKCFRTIQDSVILSE